MNVCLGAGKLEVSILGRNDPVALVILIRVPLHSQLLFDLSYVGMGSLDFVVQAEVWHKVVHRISLNLWMQVLGASS